jgi:hypothetical protein
LTPPQSEFLVEKMLFLHCPTGTNNHIQVERVIFPHMKRSAVLRSIELTHSLFIETNRGALVRATSHPMKPKIEGIQAEMRKNLIDFLQRN